MIADEQLTKNFRLYEFLKSDAAARSQVLTDRQFNPPTEVVANLRITAAILQQVRDFYGLPIRVSSGYRCPEVNTIIGSISTSQHCKGEAVDFEPLDINAKEVDGTGYKRVGLWIRDNIQFRQMIKEFGTSQCPSWLHLAHRVKDNKKECLEIGKHTDGNYIPLDFNTWKP